MEFSPAPPSAGSDAADAGQGDLGGEGRRGISPPYLARSSQPIFLFHDAPRGITCFYFLLLQYLLSLCIPISLLNRGFLSPQELVRGWTTSPPGSAREQGSRSPPPGWKTEGQGSGRWTMPSHFRSSALSRAGPPASKLSTGPAAPTLTG